MLVSLQDILRLAQQKGIAIGAFNVTNMESIRAIIGAAEETKKPVILNWAEVHAPYISMEEAIDLMLFYGGRASVPVCLNLDHGSSFETCTKAMHLGFTGVMIDASSKPFDENVAITKDVVHEAHALGVGVEAELGHILSQEHGQTAETVNKDQTYTHPQEAKKFADLTGVDALAISFGTAHGLYLEKPVLDLNRITLCRQAKDMPYVMHGGSGLSKEEFQTAVRNGIRKINFYTYMSLAGGEAVKKAMDAKHPGDHIYFHDIPAIAVSAMQECVKTAILTFALEI
jgi:fructose-bisphosphate aldolase class II